MEKHRIDDLFKHKLQEHETAPSAQAWNQLNGRLKQAKPKVAPYWWAAAAVLLLLGSGYFLINQPQGTGRPNQQLASEQATEIVLPPNPIPDEKALLPITEAASGPAIAQQENPAPLTKTLSSTPTTSKSERLAQPKAEKPIEETAPLISREEPVLAGIPDNPAESPVKLAPLTTEQAEKIIIEYKPSEVVLAQADTPPAPASPEKDESTVLKVWEEVKHANVGLADLRNAKNNLFARLNRL